MDVDDTKAMSRWHNDAEILPAAFCRKRQKQNKLFHGERHPL